MFSRMINQLQEGKPVEAGQLASLLKVALVKKQGVLQQPAACWSNDPKINPDTVHLLWAAALLGREEEIVAAAGLMLAELMARSGSDNPGRELAVVNEKLLGIVDLASNPELMVVLKKKAARAAEIISQRIA